MTHGFFARCFNHQNPIMFHNNFEENVCTILNFASDISYVQPWWVSLVYPTCVACSPGVVIHRWSKSSWTVVFCLCLVLPCPSCQKCWVRVWLPAFLSVGLLSTLERLTWTESYLNFLLTPVLSQCGIYLMGNSGCLPFGKPAVTESCYPTYGACWLF